jgi:hypothetical protein
MLKALPVVTALLAATTLWGQPEPVSVTLGQTARLTVTAHPPGSCAAQIGFLDSDGKSIGPSSHVSLQPGQSTTLDLPSSAVVKEAGQRVVIQAQVVPDQGTAASACQSDMEVNEAKPSATGPSTCAIPTAHWRAIMILKTRLSPPAVRRSPVLLRAQASSVRGRLLC